MFPTRTRDTLPQAAVALAIIATVVVLLTRLAHADIGPVDPVVTAPAAGFDWTFCIALAGAALGGLSALLHVVAPRTRNTVDDAIRDDVDKLMAFMRTLSPQNTKPAPRDQQAGRAKLGLLAAIALIGCTASQARQVTATGVVAALDCEAAHLDPQALADARSFAEAKVLQWLAGKLAPDPAKIKADLAPIKSDLGRCAIAGALAAATAIVAPAVGTATQALVAAGPDPTAMRAAFGIAVRQLGWAPVKVAGGAVL